MSRNSLQNFKLSELPSNWVKLLSFKKYLLKALQNGIENTANTAKGNADGQTYWSLKRIAIGNKDA